MKNKIKIYYNLLTDELEIVCPDKTTYWSWSDEVDKSCGWYKGRKGQLNVLNCPEDYIFVGCI